MSKLIMGIDPGTNESACVVLDTELWEPVIVWYGKNNTLISSVTSDIETLYGSRVTPVLAYERMRKYTPGDRDKGVGDSTFFTCKWYGRFVEAFFNVYGITADAYSITSPDIKIALIGATNVPNAKTHVKRALYEYFKPTGGGTTPSVGTKNKPGPLYPMRSHPSHCWDALAVAVVIHLWEKDRVSAEVLSEIY